jgi:hypothetical protein
MMRAMAFGGDVAGLLLGALLVPIAVLLVGIPLALAVRLVIEILERL